VSQSARRGRGASLALVLCVALGAAGAVNPSYRVVLHGMLALALGWLAIGARSSETSPRALWLSLAAISIAQVVGYVPVAGRASGFVSVAPWHTLSSWSAGVLVLGVCVLASAWVRTTSRLDICRALTLGLGVLVTLAVAHVILGLDQAMGAFPIEQLPARYLGPLVNANHLATCLLLLAPCALYVGRRDPSALWRGVGIVSSVGALCALVAVQSVGAALVASSVAAWAISRERAWGLRGTALLLLGGSLGVFFLLRQPTWLDHSLLGRWDQYTATLSMLAERPLLGWGSGTYTVAFERFDLGGRFVHAEHAHSDVLEWAAETGALGVVMGAVVLWLTLRGIANTSGSRRALGYGLLAASLHACIEFPLHIPAVAMLFGAVWAAWMASHRDEAFVSVAAHRRGVWALALLQVPMGLWAYRGSMASRAAAQLASDVSPLNVAQLARWEPWSPQLGLAELLLLVQSGEFDRARDHAVALVERYPDDADVLRRCGVLFATLGMDALARQNLEEALVARPSDYRAYWALGRLAARSGRGDDAVHRYGQALRRAPVDQTLVEEAYALLPVGDHWVDVLAQAEPHLSVLLYRVVYREEPEAALRAIEQAVVLRPAYYADHPLRADGLIALGRFEDARAWLRPRLADDQRGNLWAMLGNIEEMEGNLDAAVAAYLQAEARGSTHARVNAIRAIGALQDREAARKQARAWVMSGEGSPRLILELATLEYQHRDAQACLDALSMDALVTYEEWAGRVESLRKRCEDLQQEKKASPG